MTQSRKTEIISINPYLNKVLGNYSFYIIEDCFNDNQQITISKKMKESKCILINQYIAPEIDKAIHYFSLPSNQNHPDAQYALGIIYFEGKYITRDINKVIYYYSLAANQNHSLAQYNLGLIYHEGKYRVIGNDSDFSLIIKFLEKFMHIRKLCYVIPLI